MNSKEKKSSPPELTRAKSEVISVKAIPPKLTKTKSVEVISHKAIEKTDKTASRVDQGKTEILNARKKKADPSIAVKQAVEEQTKKPAVAVKAVDNKGRKAAEKHQNRTINRKSALDSETSSSRSSSEKLSSGSSSEKLSSRSSSEKLSSRSSSEKSSSPSSRSSSPSEDSSNSKASKQAGASKKPVSEVFESFQFLSCSDLPLFN
jgi:hypothetical protein